MQRFFDEGLATENYNFLDSSLTYSGASTATLTGLNHLEGELVTVTSNNAFLGTYTVSSGAITLPIEVTEAVVGLPYNHSITLLPVKVPVSSGTDLTLSKVSLSGIALMTSKTTGLSALSIESGVARVLWARKFNDYMDQAPSAYEEVVYTKLPTVWRSSAKLKIEGTAGIPAMITAVVREVEANAY
jgi:hypothetical protein